jgi:hypothetical protein
MELKDAFMIAIGFGLIGGIGNTFMYGGRFTLPRVFFDDKGDKHIIYGSLTQLFLGMLSGMIAVLPTYQIIPVGYAMYVSILSGIGGSSFIGGMLDKRVERRKYEAEDKLNKYDVDAL